ncbi:MAG TPA: hypothetical protein VK981_01320 [Ramlibacter sp.]|nr:hypothetical protein [Ramlibacter sp.]
MMRFAIVLAALLVTMPTHAQADLKATVAAARADAAQRSGLPAAQLAVVSAESVTWPDVSLGCPKPDMMYTQALVPGFRVRLKVGKEVWDYRAGERGGLVLCPPGRAQEPLPDSKK